MNSVEVDWDKSVEHLWDSLDALRIRLFALEDKLSGGELSKKIDQLAKGDAKLRRKLKLDPDIVKASLEVTEIRRAIKDLSQQH